MERKREMAFSSEKTGEGMKVHGKAICLMDLESQCTLTRSLILGSIR